MSFHPLYRQASNEVSAFGEVEQRCKHDTDQRAADNIGWIMDAQVNSGKADDKKSVQQCQNADGSGSEEKAYCQRKE